MATHPKRGKLQRLATAASASRTPSLGSISQPVNKNFKVNLPRPKLLNVTDFSALSATIQKGMVGKAQFEKKEKEADDRADGAAYLPEFKSKLDALMLGGDLDQRKYANNLISYAKAVELNIIPATASEVFWQALSGARGVMGVNSFRATDGPLAELRATFKAADRTETSEQVGAAFDKAWGEQVAQFEGNIHAQREAGSHYGSVRAEFMEDVAKGYDKASVEAARAIYGANITSSVELLMERNGALTEEDYKGIAGQGQDGWVTGQSGEGVGAHQRIMAVSMLSAVDNRLVDNDTAIVNGDLPRNSRRGVLERSLQMLHQTKEGALMLVGGNYVKVFTGDYEGSINTRIRSLTDQLEAETDSEDDRWKGDKPKIQALPVEVYLTYAKDAHDKGTLSGQIKALSELKVYSHEKYAEVLGDEVADQIREKMEEYPVMGHNTFIASLDDLASTLRQRSTPELENDASLKMAQLVINGDVAGMEALFEKFGPLVNPEMRTAWGKDIAVAKNFNTHVASGPLAEALEALNALVKPEMSPEMQSALNGIPEEFMKEAREVFSGASDSGDLSVSTAAIAALFKPLIQEANTQAAKLTTKETARQLANFTKLQKEIGSGAAEVDLTEQVGVSKRNLALFPDLANRPGIPQHHISPAQLVQLNLMKGRISARSASWAEKFDPRVREMLRAVSRVDFANSDDKEAKLAEAVSSGMVVIKTKYFEWAKKQGDAWQINRADDFVNRSLEGWVREARIAYQDASATAAQAVTSEVDTEGEEAPTGGRTLEAARLDRQAVDMANDIGLESPLANQIKLGKFLASDDDINDDDLDEIVLNGFDAKVIKVAELTGALEKVLRRIPTGEFTRSAPGDPSLPVSADTRAPFIWRPDTLEIASSDLTWNALGDKDGSALIINPKHPFVSGVRPIRGADGRLYEASSRSNALQADLSEIELPDSIGEMLWPTGESADARNARYLEEHNIKTDVWVFVPTGSRPNSERESDWDQTSIGRGKAFADSIVTGSKSTSFPSNMSITESSRSVPANRNGWQGYDAGASDESMRLLSKYDEQGPLEQAAAMEAIHKLTMSRSEGTPWSAVLDGKIRVSHVVSGRVIAIKPGGFYKTGGGEGVTRFRGDPRPPIGRNLDYPAERYSPAAINIETILPFKDKDGSPPDYVDVETRNFSRIADIVEVVTDPDLYDQETGTFMKGSDAEKYIVALGYTNSKALVSAYIKTQAMLTRYYDPKASNSNYLMLVNIGVEKK